jgi:hypothetical protein
MSVSCGRAVVAIVLDFSALNGLTVVAEAPKGWEQEAANAMAASIFADVDDAAQADYRTFADGRFNYLAAIEAKLSAVGAKLLAVDQQEYL